MTTTNYRNTIKSVSILSFAIETESLERKSNLHIEIPKCIQKPQDECYCKQQDLIKVVFWP